MKTIILVDEQADTILELLSKEKDAAQRDTVKKFYDYDSEQKECIEYHEYISNIEEFVKKQVQS